MERRFDHRWDDVYCDYATVKVKVSLFYLVVDGIRGLGLHVLTIGKSASLFLGPFGFFQSHDHGTIIQSILRQNLA